MDSIQNTSRILACIEWERIKNFQATDSGAEIWESSAELSSCFWGSQSYLLLPEFLTDNPEKLFPSKLRRAQKSFFLSFGEFRQGLTEIQLNKLLYAQPPLHKTIWLSCLVTPLHDSEQCYGTDPNGDMQWYLPPGPSLSSGTASGRPCQNSQAHGRAGRACHTSSVPACNSSHSGQSLGLSHHK